MKRLLIGFIKGIFVGALVGAALWKLWPTAMVGVFGYAFAAITGVVVGLIAGKPIWAKGAAVEVGLKSLIGALLSCGILFGLRFWHMHIPAIAGVPSAEIGHHVWASIGAISIVLALFYEIDHSGDAEDIEKHAPTRRRVNDQKSLGASSSSPLHELDDEPNEKIARKK